MRPRTSILIAIFLAGLLVSVPANAQLIRRSVSVSGTVHDSDERPLDGIEVQLFDDTGDMVSTAYTRPTGEFEFSSLRGGQYLIVINANGYEPLREDVELPGISRSDVSLVLRKAPNSTPYIPAAEEVVTARELALSQKAQIELRKGRDDLYRKHDPPRSLKDFAKVLKISPGFYEAHYYMGMAYLFEDRFTDAESAFRTAIAQSNGQYAPAFVGLATLLASTKRFPEAEANAWSGLNLQPNSWQAYLELARAQLGLNMAVEAEKSAIEARIRKPDFPDLYITLANIHIRLRNTAALLQDLQTYLKLAPSGQYSGQAHQILRQLADNNPAGAHESH